MTVIVTRMPGGVVQLFNPDTGKITYKCKSAQAYLYIDAFDGIVKFNKKGSMAVVSGPITSLEDCTIIKKTDSNFITVLKQVIESEKNFKEQKINLLHQEINDLSKNL